MRVPTFPVSVVPRANITVIALQAEPSVRPFSVSAARGTSTTGLAVMSGNERRRMEKSLDMIEVDKYPESWSENVSGSNFLVQGVDSNVDVDGEVYQGGKVRYITPSKRSQSRLLDDQSME